MQNLVFWSKNKKYGMFINKSIFNEINNMCKESKNNETGGILIGVYTKDHYCAIVKRITGPPIDSIQNKTWFERGINGLVEILGRFWIRNKQYYLGEWHYHPNSPSDASYRDIQQMYNIAASTKYNCPEPILLIIGGSIKQGFSKKVYVFPKETNYIKLNILCNIK